MGARSDPGLGGHDELQRRIGRLVVERQELRAHGAPRAELERNRQEIAELQRVLAYALIERYLPKEERSAA
jgi:hypothetical protein